MLPRIQHIVETRFSLRVDFGPTTFSHDWLLYRLGLFRRFCLPSVSAQTTDNFTWLLFCDESTEDEVMDALRLHEQEIEPLVVATTDSTRVPRRIVRSLIRPETETLITTRLDSDDAFSVDYIEAIQAYAPAFHRSTLSDLLVNFPGGYRFDMENEAIYSSRMYNSPFHSLFERPYEKSPMTVITGKHTTMHERHMTHQDESLHAWMQVLHGSNIHNKLVSTDRELPSNWELTGFFDRGVAFKGEKQGSAEESPGRS
jgi:Putative rhamnosyl transferase